MGCKTETSGHQGEIQSLSKQVGFKSVSKACRRRNIIDIKKQLIPETSYIVGKGFIEVFFGLAI